MKAPQHPSHRKRRRRNFGDRIRAWIRHHYTQCYDSLLRIVRTPVNSVVTCLLIAIAIVMPTIFYICTDALQSNEHYWREPITLSLFLHPQSNGKNLAHHLQQLPEVKTVKYIDAEQALAEFKAQSGLADMIETLSYNPLPEVIEIEPTADAATHQQLAALKNKLLALKEVAQVQLDIEWLQRFQQLVMLIERIGTLIALLLLAAVVLVISSMVHWIISNRRDEIEIIHLFGASRAFIRRPFIYTGFWYGFIGGGIAWIFAKLILDWISASLHNLLALYGHTYNLATITPLLGLQLMFGTALLGVVGSWIAVVRYLRHHIELPVNL